MAGTTTGSISQVRDYWNVDKLVWDIYGGDYDRWGLLYRSTGQNINGPNINELQINCSIGQQKPVDV
jgi:hypothetical protein